MDHGGGWTIHQVVYGNKIHSVLMLAWNKQITKCLGHLDEAMKALGIQGRSYTSYIDVATLEIGESGYCNGMVVPCQSIWGMDGRRKAGVLLFEHLVE